MKKILIVGAGGQIGSELVPHLRSIYGNNNVVAADISAEKCKVLAEAGPFEELNALDGEKYTAIVKKYDCAVFTPSSIGAFGKDTPKDKTPQDTLQRSNTTIYGVCKVTGELLSDYYFNRFGVDTRSVRFPGLISYVTLPGGGTTDYAVEIYYDAIRRGAFTCNVKAGTYMDMMYMPDALNAVVQLMEADPSRLKHRNSFNIAAMSFEPGQIAAEIRKHLPDFKMDYQIDPVKQAIADSWPNSMDDSCAREEWGWKPEYNLQNMTVDMLVKVKEKFDKGLIK